MRTWIDAADEPEPLVVVTARFVWCDDPFLVDLIVGTFGGEDA